tara:strand:- start:1231 stop:1797 length:567 start_codon:yes stop_codon:yes gene_type:complete
MPINDITCGASTGLELATVVNEIKSLAEGATRTYWFYPSDSATASSPIAHSAGSNSTFLTNNALGAITASFNPDSNSNLWNPSTNKFDFSSLKIGDIVEFRVDLLVDHGAAQEITIVADVAEGGTSPYTLNVNHDYYKTASTGVPVTAMFRLYIGNDDTKDNSARFRLVSLEAASVVVEGWLVQVTSV